MADKEKEESVLSKFSNQGPDSGGYGDREDEELTTFTKPKISVAAKKSRKKNRK